MNPGSVNVVADAVGLLRRRRLAFSHNASAVTNLGNGDILGLVNPQTLFTVPSDAAKTTLVNHMIGVAVNTAQQNVPVGGAYTQSFA
jgi:hypothetical protein